MIQLYDLPYAEAAAHLRAGAVAWVTVNPVEYHGPHLPLHTDRWQAEGLARDLHRALGEPGEVLLGADLELGAEPAPGPGSRHVPYLTVKAEVLRAAEALVEMGARRIAFVTFHGAPLHNLALYEAVSALRARGIAAAAPFQTIVRLLLEERPLDFLDPSVAMLPAQVRTQVRDALRWDFHGGYFETSLMLHWAPHTVASSHRDLPACPPVNRDRRLQLAARAARALGRSDTAVEFEYAAQGVGWQQLRPQPGYTGHPHLASAEAGAWFADLVVDRALPSTLAGLAGRPVDDRPPMRWVAPLTGWGRLSP